MSVDIVKTTNNQITGTGEQTAPPPAVTEISSRRSMAEVQAMVYMAKEFPRNQMQAEERIKIACQRPKLAKTGLYQYSKGGTKIHGVSIRVAEVIAREWGNIQYGYTELDRTPSTITAQAYAWDMETNTRAERTVTINTSQLYGQYKNEQEYERAITELVANQKQRRVRVCILAIIPSDIIETAEDECLKTQRTHLHWDGPDGEAKRKDDILRMVVAFEGMGVTRKQIEKRFQRNIDSMEPAQFMSLRSIYMSIKDGMSTIDSYFPPNPDDEPKAEKESVGDRLKKRASKVKKEIAEPDATVQPPVDDKATTLKETEDWVRNGCDIQEDFEIAIQRLEESSRNGLGNPDWLEDQKEVVRKVAKEKGITLK